MKQNGNRKTKKMRNLNLIANLTVHFDINVDFEFE